MKKILFIISLLFTFTIFVSPVVQATTVDIEISEKIPGVNCPDEKNDSGNYDCSIGTGMDGFKSMISKLIQYFTYVTMLAAVLYIVINGILYSMSGMDAGLKDSAKKRIINMLLGIILLFLSGYILYAIAPWVFTN